MAVSRPERGRIGEKQSLWEKSISPFKDFSCRALDEDSLVGGEEIP